MSTNAPLGDDPPPPPGADQAEIDAWLRRRRSRASLPREARPILVAAIASFALWFLIPVLLSPFGLRLSDPPQWSATASVGQCSRDWRSLGTTWSCEATVPTHPGEDIGRLTARADVSNRQVQVDLRRSVKSDRTDHSGQPRLVTTDIPTGGNGTVLWVIRVGSLVALWAITIAVTSRRSRRTP